MGKKLLPLLIFVLLTNICVIDLFGQPELLGFRTPFKYFAAQAEPAADWYMPGFDDSSWTIDTSRIGYGNGMEEVVIPQTSSSLYLRYYFNVSNPDAVNEMSFVVDFDDGFIAYLNGKEILRKNVDASVEKPPFDAIANRSHELEMTQNLPVLGYYFDTTFLDTCLVTGENIISVHVLNDTLNGSDLFFYLRMYSLPLHAYNMYSASYRCKRSYMPDSFILPLVIVNSDEFGIPYKNQRVKAFMGVIDKGEGHYNKPVDSCNVYYGDVSIEVKGQSSAEYSKRTYRFELIDSVESDSNVVMLGMPADNDWILMGPFADKAQFRNPMIFDLARKFGHYEPRSRYCELILNGEYVGLYSLLETIKRGEDRIDIKKLQPDELSGIDVTGGYIMRYDKDMTGTEIMYPKVDDIQQQQIDYLHNYLVAFRDSKFSNNFRDPVIGYRRYLSDTSLVDYMIMTELAKNCDGYLYSTYFYKDRADIDDRIHFGPLWDNDLVFGNTIFQDGAFSDGWHFEYDLGRRDYMNITRLLQDTALVHLFQNRYWDARQSFLNTDSIMNYIDSTVNFLREAIDLNYYIWPVIDKDIFHFAYVSQSYDDEIRFIKEWLNERLVWMDDHIDDIYYEVDTFPVAPVVNKDSYFSLQVYPNPFTDELSVAFLSSDELDIRTELIDLNGRLRYFNSQHYSAGMTEIKLDVATISELPVGIYIIRLFLNEKTIITRKVIRR
jgi:hypothetical protein